MDNSESAGRYDELLFDEAEKINQDKDYWFQLRGGNSNPLIDSATALFGLSLRVRTLSNCENIDQIYKQTVEEIKMIEMELSEKGYEHAILMAYRYILCAFLDEAIMGTEWGADSVWAEYSMLSRFHNETSGGEKVFIVLSRLENEPEKYKDLLEFIYRCLYLGFEGKYKIMKNGKDERESVIVKLHSLLTKDSKSVPPNFTASYEHVSSKKYRLSRQLPVWSVFAFFAAICSSLFIGYTFLLHEKSADVLIQLNQILK